MKQCALLIGNNAYPDSKLENAVNDATDMAAKLTGLGFSCILATDATNKEMDFRLGEFAKQCSLSEVGVFFFAGHGMQIGGDNYLAAIDTNSESELDAKHSSLPLNKVIEKMEAAGGRTSILILDACRNNPFERRWRSGGQRGLAPVYAPKGMIVGYATSPGQTAADGDGRNGAYTEALLSHIGHQDLNIETFFKRVRNSLSSSTSGKQISWEHTSLMGDYFFNHSRDVTGTVTAYSEDALADGTYQPRGSLREIINGLKSCDWYKQNRAIKQLSASKLDEAGKDDCFVLGRNIYQASCGDANAAVSFIDYLENSLSPYTENARKHLANGMFYEIYFDSRGLKRKRAKAHKLDEVFSLEEVQDFAESLVFIRDALRPYEAELFYLPGSKATVCVDVVIGKDGDLPAVTKVCYEGQNILYNGAGDGYFDPIASLFGNEVNRVTWKAKLSEALITPQVRLKINYSGLQLTAEGFQVPIEMNLRRIASK